MRTVGGMLSYFCVKMSLIDDDLIDDALAALVSSGVTLIKWKGTEGMVKLI